MNHNEPRRIEAKVIRDDDLPKEVAPFQGEIRINQQAIDKRIHNDIEAVAPVDLMLARDGDLFVYISDALTPEVLSSNVALDWACRAVNNEGEKEHNFALSISLPHAINEMLGYWDENIDGTKRVISRSVKPSLNALRAKLVEAIAVLDKIEYSD